MISWFRRRREEPEERQDRGKTAGASSLPMRTDLHSHLIPGIDDGAATLSESLELLRALEEIGYRRIVTTPHVMADSYRNSSGRILEGLEELRIAADEAGIGLSIDAAAEYYMDEELSVRLEAGDILTVGEEYLLFETSYYAAPIGLEERIFEIAAAGYRPLMAHPERYRYVRDPEDFYGRLKEIGVSFQVNINSFGGHYGEDARRKARWLSRRGWIDFLGSDLHGIRQAHTLERLVLEGAVSGIFRENRILNDTLRFSYD